MGTAGVSLFSRLPVLAALAASAGAPKAAGATLAGHCRDHLRAPIFAASVRRRSESGLAFDQLGVSARCDLVDFKFALFGGRLALASSLRVSDSFLSHSGAMAHASRTTRRAKSHACRNRDQCRHAQHRWGIPALRLGNVIEVGTGLIGIEEACSGVRSLQATLMVSLFLGELYAFKIRPRILLVAAGALFAFFCNLVRTALLVWIGARNGTKAIEAWHDPAGLTILFVCLLGLWLLVCSSFAI
jgi:exosortase/archaeosortase family protein